MLHIPTVIEKEGKTTHSYDLFSRILKDRIIMLTGPITDETAHLIVSQLLYLESQKQENIELYINSPGGSISSGMAIFSTMRHIKSPVSTIGIGLCASMGSFLLMCGEKKRRFALKDSEIMFHQPLQSDIGGQQTDIEIKANHLRKIRNKMERVIGEKTNIKDPHQFCERDNWIEPEEAKKLGIIDEVI